MNLNRVLAAAFSLAALNLFSGAAAADDRFTPSSDGQEVADSANHVSWRRCPEGMNWDGKTCMGKPTKMSLADAKALAAKLSQSTGQAWRVPNKDELAALVVHTKKSPTIDLTAFPGSPPNQFWALRSGFDDNLNAFAVSFRDGKVHANLGERKFSVRLVRTSS